MVGFVFGWIWEIDFLRCLVLIRGLARFCFLFGFDSDVLSAFSLACHKTVSSLALWITFAATKQKCPDVHRGTFLKIIFATLW